MSRSRKLAVFFTVILAVVLACVILACRFYVLPILMYHSVSAESVPEMRFLRVKPASFERQLQFLRKYHYNVIPLEDAAVLIREGKKIPAKTVVLTFDDGYADNYTIVFSLLKKYGYPATFFIIYDEVGRSDRLSWNEIREMQASGLAYFGSHAMGPEPLVNIKSDSEVRRQIVESKKKLEAMLGRPVTVFSYPEGKFNAKIRQMVIEAGYQAAVATNPGKSCPNNDIFALKRLRISSTSDSMLVFAIESSGYYNVIRENRHK